MNVQKENQWLFCIWLCLFSILVCLRITGETPGNENTKAAEQEGKEQVILSSREPETVSEGKNSETETYEPPKIRVLLTDSGQTEYLQQEVLLSSSGGIRFSESGQEISPGVQETITADDGRFINGRILLAPMDPEAGITLESIRRSQGNPVYQGTLEIYKTEQGLYIVNEVDLETYLKYVVPSEMPVSFPAEALRAQAVCARTYGVRAIENQALETYHAHVDDSVSYQVYNNVPRQQAGDQAVDDTAGQIMTFQGEAITAYFFSTSCGYTSTDEVWSGEEGEAYLKSVYLGSDSREDVQSEEVFAQFIQTCDPSDYEAEEGWYRWQAELPVQILNERLASWGIGEIQNLKVLRRSSGGAVTALEISGTEGAEVLENEYAIRDFLSVKGIPVSKNDGTMTEEMELLPSAYFSCSSLYEEGELSGFLILGGGYGHGVGMSQNGARHLAQQGYSWQEILNFFYQNITLETIQ